MWYQYYSYIVSCGISVIVKVCCTNHLYSVMCSDVQDQGLTRPKVLIIVPLRNSALRVVDVMVRSLLAPGKVRGVAYWIALYGGAVCRRVRSIITRGF